MRKILLKVLTGALMICILVSGLIACSSSSTDWKKPTLNNPGEVKNNGGFITETDNYLYFINGVANYEDDNTFGAPVKGALMVQDKTDLSKAPQIVVPKLFAGTDYGASVYVYGGRVYYGTPCTDKNSAGEIANYEMTFASTKLDGTDTKTYLTVDSLAFEYRFIQSGETVYIVYFDMINSTLYSYNTSTGKKVEIIKTDDKVKGEEAVSLQSYKFLGNDAVKEGLAVAYAVTIYDEEYYEEAASKDGYARATKNYNEVYVYGVNGDKVESKKVIDGKDSELTYGLTFVKGANIYATETNAIGKENTVCYNVIENTKTDVKNADLITEDNLVLDNGDVITMTEEGVITKRNAFDNDSATQEIIAMVESITSLVKYDSENGYVYYLDGGNLLARIKTSDENALPELVSEDSVIVVWYAPQFITLGEKDYVFYVDSSVKGGSYVKYVDLNGEVKGEDTDDDGENDKFYLEGQKFLGIRLDKDVAKEISAVISDVDSKDVENDALKFVEIDGAFTVESVVKAKAFFDSQTDAVKGLVSKNAKTKLDNYLVAIEMANKYNKLKAIKDVSSLSTDEYNALKTTYEQVKADIEAFRNSDNYTTIRALLGNDLNAYYQNAVTEFEADKVE